MGREIHYYITTPRPFTAAEMKAGEQFVLAFNELFKDGGRWGNGLFNFGVYEGCSDGAQFFSGENPFGSTKPYGEAAALFLYGGLVALSKLLPPARIEVDDEGVERGCWTICPGVVLQNGRLDGSHHNAATGVSPGQWISDINALKPATMKTIATRSKRGGLLASQVPGLLSEIERVVRERIASATSAV